MNTGLMSHQQLGHTEKGPRFNVSPERQKSRGSILQSPGFVVQRVCHYISATSQTEPSFSINEAIFIKPACGECVVVTTSVYVCIGHSVRICQGHNFLHFCMDFKIMWHCCSP